MNFVANGLDLKKGDEVINTDQEHGGGFAAWRQLAKRKGIVYKQAHIPVPVNSKEEIVNSVVSLITKKTKLIAVPHIVSVYGTVMPIKEICAIAKSKGIFTVIDGAQTVGQIDVNVKNLGCDAYYSSLHKWLLSPAGNGILYLDKSISSTIWATLSSYNWDNNTDIGFKLQQSGTGNPSLLVGLDASLDFFNMIGKDKWLNRIKFLGKFLRDNLKTLDNVDLISSSNEILCAGLTTYKVEGVTGPELQKVMWDKERLQPRSVGKELLRHSVHIYNSEDEISRAIEVIKNI
jgi:selenocysteine lyase/cysteine desulfurase